MSLRSAAMTRREWGVPRKVLSVICSLALAASFSWPLGAVPQLAWADEGGSVAAAPFEGTTEIGKGTEQDNKNAPYVNYYANAMTEQIYTAAEIGHAGTIHAIAFDAAAVDSKPLDEKLTVWLGHTDETAFSDKDSVITTGLTEVYSSDPANIGQAVGWENIAFNKSTFDYNGTSNLVVVVLRECTGTTSKNWSSALKYNATNTVASTVWLKRADGGASGQWTDLQTATGNAVGTAAVSAARPNIQLSFGSVHNVSVNNGVANGEVTTSSPFAVAGATVTVTATPAEGYKLDTIAVTDADGGNVAVDAETNTFMMPEKDVTVSATFVEKADHTVSVATGIENGSISVDKAAAKQGATVTITPTPAQGYELATITITPDSGEAPAVEDNKFIMPDANVTVSATFRTALDLSSALKGDSSLSITSSNSNDWALANGGGRSYIQSDINGAGARVTIASDKAGWLIFDWGFAGAGSWKDKFAVSLVGDTTNGGADIGANSSTYQGKWATKVIPINAGTTKVTWMANNTDGNLTAAAWLDDIRFVSEQTAVSATHDENTTTTVKSGDANVEAVAPGSSVKFSATANTGYIFAGWKKQASDTVNYSTDTTITATVYDEPVSFYAYSIKGLEGAGTEESPYLISNLADLEKLATAVNGGTTYAGQYFKLAGDIDAEQTEFAGIGNSSNAFAGVFDGDGKTISNIKLTGQGLFNYTAAGSILQNFTVDGTLTAKADKAGMVAGSLVGTIKDVTVKGSIASAKEQVGGVVGALGSNSRIENCVSEAVISVTYSGNMKPVAGGIVGECSYSTAISKCSFTGSIDGGTDASVIGGIVGITGSTTVTECVVKASITGKQHIGGIVGYTNSAALVLAACEYDGNISGVTNVGGIVGYLYGPYNAGSSTPKVNTSLACGTVTASNGKAGGIVGFADRSAEVDNCVALQSTVSGDSAARVAIKGTNSATLLSNNTAWAGVKVNDAIVSSDAATAVGDGTDGASVETDALLGESVPAQFALGDAWTVVAGKKPQLTALAEVSGNAYSEYILQAKDDAEAAKPVIEQIDELPAAADVTLDDEKAIADAEKAYADLNEGQQACVTNYSKLQAARAQYDKLDAAKAAEDATKAAEEASKAADAADKSKKDADEAAKTPGDAAVKAAEKAAADAKVAADKAAAAKEAADAAVTKAQKALDSARAAGDEDAVAAAEEALDGAKDAQVAAGKAVEAASKAKTSADNAVTSAKTAASEATSGGTGSGGATSGADDNAPIGGVKAGQAATAGSGANAADYTVLKPATKKAPGTVAYKKAKKAAAKKVTVPATVQVKGGTYKVVTIKSGAFRNMKKLKSVTIGANVAKVEAKAFTKTPKLAKITVKSKLLKSKASVKGALKGSKAKKLTVKAPKAVKKACKKSFSKKNLKAPKAVKVK